MQTPTEKLSIQPDAQGYYEIRSEDLVKQGSFHYYDGEQCIAKLQCNAGVVEMEFFTPRQINIVGSTITANALHLNTKGSLLLDAPLQIKHEISLRGKAAYLRENVNCEGAFTIQTTQHFQNEKNLNVGTCRIASPIWIQAGNVETQGESIVKVRRYVQNPGSKTTINDFLSLEAERCKIGGDFSAMGKSEWKVDQLSLGKEGGGSVLNFMGDKHTINAEKAFVEGTGKLNHVSIQATETQFTGEFSLTDASVTSENLFLSQAKLTAHNSKLEITKQAIQYQSTLSLENASTLTAPIVEVDGELILKNNSLLKAENRLLTSKDTTLRSYDSELNIGVAGLSGNTYLAQSKWNSGALTVRNIFHATDSSLKLSATPELTAESDMQLNNTTCFSDEAMEVYGKLGIGYRSTVNVKKGFHTWNSSALIMDYRSHIQAHNTVIRGQFTTLPKPREEKNLPSETAKQEKGIPAIVCTESFALRTKNKIDGAELSIEAPQQENESELHFSSLESRGKLLVNYGSIDCPQMNFVLDDGLVNYFSGRLYGRVNVTGSVIDVGMGVRDLSATGLFVLTAGFSVGSNNYTNAVFSIETGAAIRRRFAKILRVYQQEKREGWRSTVSAVAMKLLEDAFQWNNIILTVKGIVAPLLPESQKIAITKIPELMRGIVTLTKILAKGKELSRAEMIAALLQFKNIFIQYRDISLTKEKMAQKQAQKTEKDSAENEKSVWKKIAATDWKKLGKEKLEAFGSSSTNQSIFHWQTSAASFDQNVSNQNLVYVNTGNQKVSHTLDVEASVFGFAASVDAADVNLRGGTLWVDSLKSDSAQIEAAKVNLISETASKKLEVKADEITDTSILSLNNGATAKFEAKEYVHEGSVTSDDNVNNKLTVAVQNSTKLAGTANVANGEYHIPKLDNADQFCTDNQAYNFPESFTFHTQEDLHISKPLRNSKAIELGANSIRFAAEQKREISLALQSENDITVSQELNVKNFIAGAKGNITFAADVTAQDKLSADAGDRVIDMGANLHGKNVQMHGQQGVILTTRKSDLSTTGLQQMAHNPEVTQRLEAASLSLQNAERNFTHFESDKTKAKAQAKTLEQLIQSASDNLLSGDPEADNLKAIRDLCHAASKAKKTTDVHGNLRAAKTKFKELMERNEAAPPKLALAAGDSISADQNTKITTGPNADMQISGGFVVNAQDTLQVKVGGDMIALPGSSYSAGKYGSVENIHPVQLQGGTGVSNNRIGLDIEVQGSLSAKSLHMESQSETRVEAAEADFEASITKRTTCNKTYNNNGFWNGQVPRFFGAQGAQTQKFEQASHATPSALKSKCKASITTRTGAVNTKALQVAATEVTINGEKDVNLSPVMTESFRQTKKTGLLGAKKITTEKHEHAVPTRVVGIKGASVASQQGKIRLHGAEVIAPTGNRHFKAAQGVEVTCVVENHYRKTDKFGYSFIYPGHRILKAYKESGSLWKALRNEVTLLKRLKHLAKNVKDKDILGYLQNNWNMGIETVNAISSAMHVAAHDASGKPNVAIVATRTKRRKHWQTARTDLGYAAKSTEYDAPIVTYTGAREKIGQNVTFKNTKKIELYSLKLHSSVSQTKKSVSVSPSYKPHMVDVGVSRSRDRVTSVKHVNAQLEVGAHVNYGQPDNLRLQGGKIISTTASGEIERADEITQLDKTKFSHSSLSMDTAGNFAISKVHGSSAKASEVSGMHVRQGIGPDLHIKKLHMEGAQNTSNGKVELHADEVTGKKLTEYEKTRGFAINGNLNDLARLNPKRKPKTGEKPIGELHTMLQRRTKTNKLKSVVHGDGGTTLVTSSVNGSVHTKSANGRTKSRETKIDLDVIVPLTNKQSLQQFEQTVTEGVQKIRDGAKKVVRFFDAKPAEEVSSSSASLDLEEMFSSRALVFVDPPQQGTGKAESKSQSTQDEISPLRRVSRFKPEQTVEGYSLGSGLPPRKDDLSLKNYYYHAIPSIDFRVIKSILGNGILSKDTAESRNVRIHADGLGNNGADRVSISDHTVLKTFVDHGKEITSFSGAWLSFVISSNNIHAFRPHITPHNHELQVYSHVPKENICAIMLPEKFQRIPFNRLPIIFTYNVCNETKDLDEFLRSEFSTSLFSSAEVTQSYEKVYENISGNMQRSFSVTARETMIGEFNKVVMNFLEGLYKEKLHKNEISIMDMISYHTGLPIYDTTGRMLREAANNSSAITPESTISPRPRG